MLCIFGLIALIVVMLSSLSSAGVLHCFEEDQAHHNICLRCDEGYILDQMGSSCGQIELEGRNKGLANCIQISNSGECMRCGCGHALQIELSVCMLASNSLIGCETFTGEDICIRPKAAFMFLRENSNKQPSLLFARGTHCEVFNLPYGSCSQCHSGYKLDNENRCQGLAQRTVNDFYSYFSLDGELLSRSVQFITTAYGIYPKINNCDVYLIQADSSFPLQCEKCSSGKSLNSSKNLCLKQPFDSCQTVSDTDHSLCEECIEKDFFYLSFQGSKQICLPRSQLDPTTRCLQHFQFSPKCKQCSNGLISTDLGCDIYQSSSNSQIQQTQFPLSLVINDPNCNISLSLGVCISCRNGMVLNKNGECQYLPNNYCLIPSEEDGCSQCKFHMQISQLPHLCIEITQKVLCIESLGFSDHCEQCISLYYVDSNGICTLLNRRRCAYSSGKESKCEQCQNLFYLTDSECIEITHSKNCLFSNGINDACLKCKRNYILSSTRGDCIPRITVFDTFCVDPLYYLDQTSLECVEYDFPGANSCYKFDYYYNRCHQCNSGYFIDSGSCFIIESCSESDGIQDKCYYTSSTKTYLDEYGKVKLLDPSVNCITNHIQETCVLCGFEKFVLTAADSRCILNEKPSNEEILNYCLHFTLFNVENNQYICDLCSILYYPDEEGICQPINYEGCIISDGRLKKCVLCRPSYTLNSLNGICEYLGQAIIPFCEIVDKKNNACIKCKSLFYISNNSNSVCESIYDPDCEDSEGIYNRCLHCKNGLVIDVNFSVVVNDRVFCVQYAMLLSSLSPGEITWRSSQGIAFPSIQGYLINHCKRQSLFSLDCLECENGYSLMESTQPFSFCVKINIPNCLRIENDIYQHVNCVACADGYFLTPNRFCIQLINCLEFNEVCMRCTEQAYLKNGYCYQIENCEEQQGQRCLRCLPGYWLRDKKEEEGQEVFLYRQKEGQNEQESINKNRIRSQKEESLFNQECIRMQRCASSDGIRQFCQQCENGFKLCNQICVRMNNIIDNCKEYNAFLECIECENLFFLENTSCRRMEDPNCEKNNRRNNWCDQCSLEGYKLSNLDHSCEAMNFCVISNGRDSCVICEKDYIVSSEGRCVQVVQIIPNCELYSFKKLLPVAIVEKKMGNKNEFGKSSDINDKKEANDDQASMDQDQVGKLDSPDDKVSNLQEQEQLQKQQQESSIIDSSKIEKENYGCIKCTDRFSLDKVDFQSCSPVLPFYQEKCAFSDGVSLECAVCQQGYYTKQSIQNSEFKCLKSKISAVNRRGCKLFDKFNNCIQCFDGFFQTQTGLCQSRYGNNKCIRFNPSKDECLECRNGYKMKEIVENNIKKMICIELQGKEIVRNCEKYAVNTNKCVECKRSQQKDLVEFLLNEKENLCEYVLHLMCRKISKSNNTISCLEDFILNCIKYDKQARNCLSCKNGFYLDKNQLCTPHQLIQNCGVYSQSSANTCEVCERLFFLSEHGVCQRISHLNCKIGEKQADRCFLCEKHFAISTENGACIESTIQNCRELIVQLPLSEQTCRKCKDNFILSLTKNECLFQLLDFNCKTLNPSDNVCLECKEGFFLNNQLDCISMNSSCRLSNCLKYYPKSTADDINMHCQECQSNYYLNSNKKCILKNNNADPKMQESEERGKGEEDLRGGKAANQTSKENNTVLIPIITIIGLVLLAYAIIKHALCRKKTQIIAEKEENKYMDETNIEVQMGQAIHKERCEISSQFDDSESFQN